MPCLQLPNFYPASPGEVLADRYQMLVKIGWGTRSTVWLARDTKRYKWRPERLVALKTNNRKSHMANHKREIEEHIADTNPSHRGYDIIRTCSESFEVVSREGKHLCLVYEPMREPLWLYQRRFVDQRIPLPILKAYLLMLLAGFDYLHWECRIIHTDLKLENILVTFENPDVLRNFIKMQTELPMQHKVDTTGRAVFRCHNDFGPLKGLMNLPKIGDFGLSSRLDQPDFGIYPIQPDHYRAPEVILGCGWTTSADIWNLGVVWDLVERTELFCHVHDKESHYDSRAHLAEMIGLLGPPPRKLLAKARAMLEREWPDAVKNEEDRLSRNAQQFFGGSFFDDEGNFMYDELISNRRLEDTLPSLQEKERDKCLSFVSEMLAWLPEQRKTARDLMDHPFLVE